MTRPIRALAAAFTLAIAAGVSGCGVDDVELNGKIFDAMGVSPSTQTKSKDPKMVARAPLVIPPGLERLPEPGKPAQAQPDNDAVAALADPDKVAANNQAQLEQEQAEYCKKHYEFAKMHGDGQADSATGPLGLCRGTALTAIKKVTKWSDDDGDGQEGQVER